MKKILCLCLLIIGCSDNKQKVEEKSIETLANIENEKKYCDTQSIYKGESLFWANCASCHIKNNYDRNILEFARVSDDSAFVSFIKGTNVEKKHSLAFNKFSENEILMIKCFLSEFDTIESFHLHRSPAGASVPLVPE